MTDCGRERDRAGPAALRKWAAAEEGCAPPPGVVALRDTVAGCPWQERRHWKRSRPYFEGPGGSQLEFRLFRSLAGRGGDI